MSEKLSPARFEAGLAAYRSGKSLVAVLETVAEIEDMEATSVEERKERNIAGPSFVAGFADGLLTDIRFIAQSMRRGRA